jgi:hypothetical protein
MDNFSKALDNSVTKPFSKIVINWSRIAGPSNREIMMPVELKKGVLTIAVPNGMVIKAAARFKQKIIDNIIRITGFAGLTDIKFSIDPKYFKSTPEKKKIEKETIKICEEETAKIKEKLVKEGISSQLAETFAQIEQLWEKGE